MKTNETPICPTCGEKMSGYSAPREFILLAIGRLEIRLWWWGIAYACAWCVNDNEADMAQEIFEDGHQKGYQEGLNDAAQVAGR